MKTIKMKFISLLCYGMLTLPLGMAQEQAEPKVTVPAGEDVSLNLPQMGVVDALRMLGQLSNLNMVIDPKVSGVVDLFMEDVSLEQAWDSVLDSANLSVLQTGDVLKIMPKEAAATPSTPRETRVIKLKYISLGNMKLSGGIGGDSQQNPNTQNPLQNQFGGESQSTGDAQLDEILQGTFQDAVTVFKDVRTNHLILSGEAKLLDEAQAVIETLDQPISQILIEAQIVQIRTQAMQDLGIDWGGVYTFQNSGSFELSGDRTTTQPGNVVTDNNAENLNFGGSLGQFTVVLSALIDDGDAQILFKPRVVTQNNKEAYISSGQEIQIPSGLDINGNASFRERQVVLELGVTPQVMANDLISLSIRVKNDTINFSQPDVSGVPPLDVNSIESFITLRDMDTVIIGGILSSQNSSTQRRVPFLSGIPLLGRAFRNDSRRFEQSELMLLITPRIISDEFGFINYDASAGLQPNSAQKRVIDTLADDEPLWRHGSTSQRRNNPKRSWK
jgi:type IV pilus assembly protein PilQ